MTTHELATTERGKDDRVAVITGGASGIGFATAALLARSGWSIVLADIEEPALKQASEELSKAADVYPVVTDVADRESVEELADRAFSRFHHVDVLFNNAGVALARHVADMTHDDW